MAGSTAGDYLAELHALAPEAALIVDKMPGNARYLGFIATLLPGARIIHCRRDPRDIGLSIFQLRFFAIARTRTILPISAGRSTGGNATRLNSCR